MTVEVLPAAQADLDSDADYYEERSSGLGGEFLTAVDSAFSFLARFPRAGRPLAGSTQMVRRWTVQKYLYTVIYVLLEGRVLVLAVAHSKRDPDYWQSRVP